MHVSIQNIWKRYSTQWIIRELNCEIQPGQHWAIMGLNGSGKSTLMQMFAGYLSQTKGDIRYTLNNIEVNRNSIYKYLAFNAAYAEMDEELTVLELFDHYSKFKPYKISSHKSLVEIADLRKERNKAVNTFSSGMKQRLALTLTVLMDTPYLLLDEPTSFLDTSRKSWFKELITEFAQNRTTIIASNDEDDFASCDFRLAV